MRERGGEMLIDLYVYKCSVMADTKYTLITKEIIGCFDLLKERTFYC